MFWQRSRTFSWRVIYCYARRKLGRRVPTRGNIARDWTGICQNSGKILPQSARFALKPFSTSRLRFKPLYSGLLLRASLGGLNQNHADAVQLWPQTVTASGNGTDPASSQCPLSAAGQPPPTDLPLQRPSNPKPLPSPPGCNTPPSLA